MKYIFTILFILNLTYISNSQNLVPNPSFEDTIECPYTTQQINFSKFWNSPTEGSPDYYNKCTESPFVSIPKNMFGWQYPKTGSAYVGISLFSPTSISFREYIQTELINLLDVNKKYYIVFFINLSNRSNYAVNNIGVYFSNTSFYEAHKHELTFNTQIENSSSNPLTDTLNWMKVEGIYKAKGGEKYITIGNYKNDTNSDIVNIGTGDWDGAYYYIDDVSVTQCDKDTVLNYKICEGESIIVAGKEYNTIGTFYDTIPTKLGCDSVLKINIEKGECPLDSCSLTVPNVFTPNNDGVNDVFTLTITGIDELKVNIYNRWGNLVYEQTGKDISWDGKNKNGDDVTDGVYYYLIDYNCENGEQKRESGFVVVSR